MSAPAHPVEPRAYESVLATLRRADADVRFCVQCGSRVYGTAGPESDSDFVVVLRDRVPTNLLWSSKINVVVHNAHSYERALDEESVFALEAYFAPTQHRMKDADPPFVYRTNRGRLIESASAKSQADWSKAKKRFDEEPRASLKRVLHSLRVVAFAGQIVKVRAITDFQVAVPWWEELLTGPYETWEAIERRFGPVRQDLLDALHVQK